MEKIILLNNSHKKIVEDYIYKHPFSCIFISNTFYKKGLENNNDLDSADFFGIIKDDLLIGICTVYNLNICILACNKKIEKKFLEKIQGSRFYILRNPYINKKYEQIKSEIFMIYNKKITLLKNDTSIANNTKDNLEQVLSLKIDFETEYWNYIPDIEHIKEFETNIKEKMVNNNVFIYKEKNNVMGCGFIESENPRCALIGSIFVKKDFRGIGLGKKITQYMIYEIKRRNKIPALTVEKNNIHAFNIYKNTGFCEISKMNMFGII